MQRALAAEQPDAVGRGQAHDGADSQVRLRAAGHVAQHVDVVGDGGRAQVAVAVLALSGPDARHGRHPRGGPHPAHQRLVPDAHREDVVAAQVAVLPPVQRALGFGEAAAGAHELNGEDVAQVAVVQHVADRAVDAEGEGGRNDLRDQVGALAGGGQHRAGLRGAHGHAGLGEDVLAPGQGAKGDGAVHVGPRADADRVGVVGIDQVRPLVVDRGDAELVGDLLARRAAAVGDADDLDAILGLEAGDVHEPGVGPGADDADSNRCVAHGCSLRARVAPANGVRDAIIRARGAFSPEGVRRGRGNEGLVGQELIAEQFLTRQKPPPTLQTAWSAHPMLSGEQTHRGYPPGSSNTCTAGTQR